MAAMFEFPFRAEPPKPAALLEVSPGIFSIRLGLPFRLNHINVYLIEEATASPWSTPGSTMRRRATCG